MSENDEYENKSEDSLLDRAIKRWTAKIKEINKKYSKPRLKMTPLVKISLLVLRLYLICWLLYWSTSSTPLLVLGNRRRNMEKNGEARLPEGTYFLSDVLNEKVLLKGKKIGKISDLIIRDKDKVAEVTHLVISRPFGYPSLMMPWETVMAFDGKEIFIDVDDVEKFAVKIPNGVVLLKNFILDKKILDMEDNDVEVVYDIKMVLKKNKLYVTDVDSSSYARFRRMGLDLFDRSTSPFANLIKKGHEKSEDALIPWSYVQALPPDLDSFKGNVKLKILKEKLNDLPPVDLVEILEDLDHEQRVMVINQLDADQASDALEEIGPNKQREIISSLRKEMVAKLIDMMTPGQAADVLSVLTFEDQNAIMKLMDDENIDKIKSILEKQQENIQNITTEKYLKVSPRRPSNQLRMDIRSWQRTKTR